MLGSLATPPAIPSEILLNAIRHVQQGGVPMSAEIARKIIQHFQTQPASAADVERLSPRALKDVESEDKANQSATNLEEI